MSSVQVIRDLVSSYVLGAISASDLANSFPPVLVAAMKSNDVAAKELALKVREQLANFSSGYISEPLLHSQLSPIRVVVDQSVIEVVIDPPSPPDFQFARSNQIHSAFVPGELQPV